MDSPDVYNLTRIRWQIFGTLTFRSERLPEQIRQGMWLAHCRKTCASFGVYFPNALWCLRQERGEATGRRHFHYLFGGLPEKAVTEATCFAQMAAWSRFRSRCVAHAKVWCMECQDAELKGPEHWREELNPAKNVGGGMARVRIFNRALNGVGYVTKCLGVESLGSGADQYELNKFGLETSEIRLSSGAQATLRRTLRDGRRNIERLEKISCYSKVSQAKSTVCVPPTNWQPKHNAAEVGNFVARGELSSSAFTRSLKEYKRNACAFHEAIDERLAGVNG